MKTKMRPAAFWLQVLLLVSALALQQGCGGGSADTATVEPQSILGASFVSAGTTVEGAMVSYVDLATNANAVPLGTTNANGMDNSAQIAQMQASHNFRIEAKGGKLSDTIPLNGTMKAEIRNYSGSSIYLNPVTTLVSAYMAAHPDITLAQAEEAVRRFLRLPAGQDLGVGLQLSTPEFSYGQFLSELNAAPSFDAFIDTLRQEMDASPSATHSFAGQLLQGAASTIGVALAKGALQELGGVAMSKALQEMGISDGTPDYSGQLAAIQNSLKQLQAGLAALDAKTNAILSAVQAANYNAGTYSVTQLIATVLNQTEALNTLVNATSEDYKKSKVQYDGLRATYFNTACRLYNSDFGKAADTIDTLLRGSIAGTTPLITAFGKTQTAGKAIFTWEDSEQYNKVRMYWESVHAALYNMIDIYLAIGTSPALCNSTADSIRFIADVNNPNDLLMKERRELANVFLNRLYEQRKLYPRYLLPRATAVYLDRQLMISLADPAPRFLPAHTVAHGYYPGHKSYSSTDLNGWNYANRLMNSSASTLSATPQTAWPSQENPVASSGTATSAIDLRKDWRLPHYDELADIFRGYYAGAASRGLPADLMVMGTVAAMFDPENVDSSGCVLRLPFGGCQAIGMMMDITDRKASLVDYAKQEVLVFPVRKLTPAEDYYRQ